MSRACCRAAWSSSCGRSKYSGHVFNVDLTTIATALGFWVPWLPQALGHCWPFAWWVGVVIDHFSRRVVGIALWRKEPTAGDVTAMLDTAAAVAGRYPRHLISDRGTQFHDAYRNWCKARGAQPRFGAVGRYGSIAILDHVVS